MALSRSAFPARVGSATRTARSAPDSAAITGQPMPGGPSISSRDADVSTQYALALRFSMATSLPELPSPAPRMAWNIMPPDVRVAIHVPEARSTIVIASEGHSLSHRPQPSHAIPSMRGPAASSKRTASKRHDSAQMRHLSHLEASKEAAWDAEKPPSWIKLPETRRWRFGASTSQSTSTASGDRAEKPAISVVLPVPPFPLSTTTSFSGAPPSSPKPTGRGTCGGPPAGPASAGPGHAAGRCPGGTAWWPEP